MIQSFNLQFFPISESRPMMQLIICVFSPTFKFLSVTVFLIFDLGSILLILSAI